MFKLQFCHNLASDRRLWHGHVLRPAAVSLPQDETGTRARQGGPQTFLVLYLAFSFQAVTHITDVPQGAEFTVSIEANFQFYSGGVLDNPECDAQLMALVRDQPWRDGGLHEQCGGGLRRLDTVITVCSANVMRVGTLPLYKPFTSFIYLLR